MFDANNVFIDLEVIPGCQWFMDEAAAKVAPPANYSKPETIKEWEATIGLAKRDEAQHAVGLIPMYGKIITIGFAVNDGPIHTLQDDNEEILLNAFFGILHAELSGCQSIRHRWVGHNICGFDLPYLWTRCLVNDVDSIFLPKREYKPWFTEHAFDTLYQLAGTKYSGHSLGNMAKVFGIPDKYPGVDGSLIWDMHKQGLHSVIKDYCENDVWITRQLYKRMDGFV